MSLPLTLDLANGSDFEFTGYFGTDGSGGATSDYAVGLQFNDVANTFIDLSSTDVLGPDGGLFNVSGVPGGSGATRVQLVTLPDPNRWAEFGHNVSYSGGPATEVTVIFEARTGGGQTYFDNFTLIQTDSSGFILGDINGDGSVDLLDVAPFIDLLASGGYLPAADINMDGAVDLLDVGPFIDLLAGG